MPKIPKLETLQELYDHIDQYCWDKGLDIDHKDFEALMEDKSSALKVKKTFECHYESARKWVKVYKNNKGVGNG